MSRKALNYHTFAATESNLGRRRPEPPLQAVWLGVHCVLRFYNGPMSRVPHPLNDRDPPVARATPVHAELQVIGPAATTPDLKTLLTPIAADMQAVDAVIRERLSSDVPLINTISDYIIGAGGKRLRPAVVLLVARALGYRGTAHVLLAAVIEFIHTATLLHDDVVDESDLRRGTIHGECHVR